MAVLISAFQRFSLSAFYPGGNMERNLARGAEQPGYRWRIFWVLLIASTLGVAGLLPYLLALFKK